MSPEAVLLALYVFTALVTGIGVGLLLAPRVPAGPGYDTDHTPRRRADPHHAGE